VHLQVANLEDINACMQYFFVQQLAAPSAKLRQISRFLLSEVFGSPCLVSVMVRPPPNVSGNASKQRKLSIGVSDVWWLQEGIKGLLKYYENTFSEHHFSAGRIRATVAMGIASSLMIETEPNCLCEYLVFLCSELCRDEFEFKWMTVNVGFLFLGKNGAPGHSLLEFFLFYQSADCQSSVE
jgi:hypothetical protein